MNNLNPTTICKHSFSLVLPPLIRATGQQTFCQADILSGPPYGWLGVVTSGYGWLWGGFRVVAGGFGWLRVVTQFLVLGVL